MGDEVDVVAHGPLDEAAVLLGHRREVDRDAGDVDALARTHGAADEEFTVELRVGLPDDADLQLAVGDQHPGSDGDVADNGGDVHVDDLPGGEVGAVGAAHGDPVAGPEIDAVAIFVGDGRHTDLGALGVDHDRDGGIDPMDGLDDLRGPLLGDVGRIHADDVHPGVEEFLHELLGAAEIRHRGDDLGFFHAIHKALVFRYQTHIQRLPAIGRDSAAPRRPAGRSRVRSP